MVMVRGLLVPINGGCWHLTLILLVVFIFYFYFFYLFIFRTTTRQSFLLITNPPPFPIITSPQPHYVRRSVRLEINWLRKDEKMKGECPLTSFFCLVPAVSVFWKNSRRARRASAPSPARWAWPIMMISTWPTGMAQSWARHTARTKTASTVSVSKPAPTTQISHLRCALFPKSTCPAWTPRLALLRPPRCRLWRSGSGRIQWKLFCLRSEGKKRNTPRL